MRSQPLMWILWINVITYAIQSLVKRPDIQLSQHYTGRERLLPSRKPAAVMLQPIGIGSSNSDSLVNIANTGFNSRRISASIVVAAAPEYVWQILTDYDNLAVHVPNLVVSELRPHPSGGIRLYQEGAQKIVGFDFRASLTMDMVEQQSDGYGPSGQRSIEFSLVDSAMFANFDGEWRVQPYSRRRSSVDPAKFDYTSKLFYRVDITPKGLVPVPALEWRIKEDVPVNLVAVKQAAEKLKAAANGPPR